MSLWTPVELNENGSISEDDGRSSWDSTLVMFGWEGIGVIADVHHDSYSWKAVAKITHDDTGLPADLLEQLAIHLYWACGQDMRDINCELGFALCNLESTVKRLFYRADADRMMRKFRAIAAGGLEARKSALPISNRRAICMYKPLIAGKH